MMYNLFLAIQQHFIDSIMPPLLGGFFFGPAPQDTTGDFATFSVPSSTPGYAMGDTQAWQDTRIQCSLWTEDHTPARLLQTADLWCECFDDAPLAVNGGACVWMRRVNGPLPVADPDGGWQIVIDYDISIDEVN